MEYVSIQPVLHNLYRFTVKDADFKGWAYLSNLCKEPPIQLVARIFFICHEILCLK